MIEVIYEPRKKVVIHEYLAYDKLEDLARIQALGVAPGGLGKALRWVDGIAMQFSAMPMNETITKELLNGVLHWDYVSFAELPKYKNGIRLEQVNVTVPIINVDHHEIFRAIASFLKKRLPSNKSKD